MQLHQIPKKTSLIVALVAIIALGGGVFAKTSKRDITVTNPTSTAKPTSTPKLERGVLSGKECVNAGVRPLAVMYASDPEARPLSGIASADIVVEMPVTENGVTRMVAFFQCTEPDEYGSIRSARMDFLPLVQGFDAIYLHWGGEHEVLTKLDAGLLDNIDCLKLDGSTCHRKSNRPRPHNGFSNLDLVTERIKKSGYRATTTNLGYEFEEGKSLSAQAGQEIIAPPSLYGGVFAVRWTYDPIGNRYSRFRSGTVELDQLTNLQAQADNVIIMKTTSEYVSILYNRVKTTGSGTATIYKNGQAISGTWSKPNDTARLVFKDTKGNPLKLNRGTTWIEIVTQ